MLGVGVGGSSSICDSTWTWASALLCTVFCKSRVRSPNTWRPLREGCGLIRKTSGNHMFESHQALEQNGTDSRNVTSHHIASHRIVSHHVTSHHVTSRYKEAQSRKNDGCQGRMKVQTFSICRNGPRTATRRTASASCSWHQPDPCGSLRQRRNQWLMHVHKYMVSAAMM